jgi:type IV pilus assembly protein PilY1
MGTIVSITNYAPDVVISELGETWSEPQFGLVKTSDEDNHGPAVFFIGGGYSSNNSAGKTVLVINVFTGQVVREFSNLPDMDYSIPSSVTVVDGDSNGFVDKAYVGDLGSQMWRFGKFTDSDDNALTFPATDENIMNWTDQAAHIIFLSDWNHRRKYFYPPSVTLEQDYDLVFMGTGNRENPCNPFSSDRIYAVKDSHDFVTLNETVLVDVTDPTAPIPNLNDAEGDVDENGRVDKGWYIRLEQGEKVLSEGVVFFKTYYVTTFMPDEGAATLYALNYLTGEAVLPFTGFPGSSGDIIRSIEIGRGIASRPVVVITEEGEKLLVSVGSTRPNEEGGPVGPGILVIEPAAPPSNFFYLWWKEL